WGSFQEEPMLKIMGFAAGMLLSVGCRADSFDDYNRWQTERFNSMEADRMARNAQSQLDSMRAEQARQDQLTRSNPVDGDYSRPTYVPYGRISGAVLLRPLCRYGTPLIKG